MLSIYFIGLALMIYWSWSFNCKFLIYFGFMQGRFTKTLFLIFCACFTLPGSDGKMKSPGPAGNYVASIIISSFLGVCALLQLIKLCNTNEEKIRFF